MIEYIVLYLLVGMFLAVSYNVTMPRFLRLLVGWPGLLIPRVCQYYSGYYDAKVTLAEVRVISIAKRVMKTRRRLGDWYLAGFSDALKESK